MPKRVPPPTRQPVPDELRQHLGKAGAPLERCRLAIIELTRRKEQLTKDALAEQAEVRAALAVAVLRLYKAEKMPPIFQPWDDVREETAARAPAGELEAAVRAARDLEQIADVANRVAASLAAGLVDPTTARALKELLGEQRQALLSARSAPPAVPTEELLCTPDAADLVALYESLVNGRRRAAVVAFARQQALEDAKDFPAEAQPAAVRAKLDELQLDPFGDPRKED